MILAKTASQAAAARNCWAANQFVSTTISSRRIPTGLMTSVRLSDVSYSSCECRPCNQLGKQLRSVREPGLVFSGLLTATNDREVSTAIA